MRLSTEQFDKNLEVYRNFVINEIPMEVNSGVLGKWVKTESNCYLSTHEYRSVKPPAVPREAPFEKLSELSPEILNAWWRHEAINDSSYFKIRTIDSKRELICFTSLVSDYTMTDLFNYFAYSLDLKEWKKPSKIVTE